MKKTIILGIILAMAAMLCSCSGGEVARRRVKQEIVVACGRDATGTMKNLMNEFTAQSETTQVKLIEFSNESTELYRAVSAMLAGKEVPLDAMLIEDVWVSEFVKNGYLQPLGGSVSFDRDSYHPAIVDFAQTDGDLYWYPLILDTGLMYYRDDITDGSLDYRQLAEQSAIRYAVQGADGEEMICCAMELIHLTGSVRDGVRLYKKAIDGSVPGDPVTSFKNGDAAYVRAWTCDNSDIMRGYSPVAAQVSTKVLMRTDGEAYATARAYGMSVNAASEKAENVKELLNYLATPDVKNRILKEMGTLPMQSADYENPFISYYRDYIDDTFPMFQTLKFRAKKEDYTHLSKNAETALSEYLTGDGSIDAAAAAIENLLDDPQ